MGLWNFVKSELIDIIEWRDENPDLLVYRFERHDHEIKMNAKLIVRPGQKAVFVNEGQIADIFDPGTHTLSTKNIPILATLKGWAHGFDSPYKAEVYFIKTSEQLDRKWGTQNPVIMRDNDFGMVRLRSRGNYTYRLNTDAELLSRFVGAQTGWSCESLESQLRARIVSSFSDCLGEAKIPALDLPANYNEISSLMQSNLENIFTELGLVLINFTIENITLSEEVEAAIDQRGSISAVGNLNQFAQYQAAQALRDMANNQSGGADMMGMMMGGQMANGLNQVLHQEQPQAATTTCPNCKEANAPSAKFCGSCGQSLQKPKMACVKCGAELSDGAKFCGECGASQKSICIKCGGDLASGAKFCGECGAAQS